MQKIACIFSFKESSWVSCQKIVFNLHEAWRAVPKSEVVNFNYVQESEKDDFKNLASAIFAADPDIISFIDHKPHPWFLLGPLLSLYSSSIKKPKIVFHIFGDFSLYYTQWDKTQAMLKGYETRFLVASPRQKILVDRMLKDQDSLVCPFPVNSEDFFYAPTLRETQRKIWGLKESETVYVFTGRLSRQKRIKTLIKTFATTFQHNKDTHLYVYGYSDSVGDPFMGRYDIENEYFRNFYRTYKELPAEIQSRIHFMGAVSNKELLPVYHGADFLVNLSVHNDEDYGMSVAEAQLTGLTSILTDWGGLAGFFHEEHPHATLFVPVLISRKGKVVPQAAVVQAFQKSLEQRTENHRQQISRLALTKFGIAHSGEVLAEMCQSPWKKFEGFSKLLTKVARAQLNHLHIPMYRTDHNEVNNLYREIYSSYVRQN